MGSAGKIKPVRDNALDALRGLVMVIMALDHVRDFFHADALRFAPEDFERGSVALFFTRWITHFCAPTFMLAAGAGAWLRRSRGASTSQLSGYLLTRGLWLVLLEVIVFRFITTFSLTRGPLLLVVLWSLGMSMVALSALVHLPPRWLLTFSVATICLHNLGDSVRSQALGPSAGLWKVLHEPGLAISSPLAVVIAYPLIPWIGVMAAGYCFGQVLTMEFEARQKWLVRLGFGAVVAFVILRGINIYGDPSRWTTHGSGLTVLSFLNVTKYPPSLDFVLMTLGPSLLALAVFSRIRLSSGNPLVVIGRVPLFYFLGHFFLAHLLAIPFAFLRYGANSGFILSPPPNFGGSVPYPANFGYSLLVVYLVWIAVVAIMYPLCVWYGRTNSPLRRWI